MTDTCHPNEKTDRFAVAVGSLPESEQFALFVLTARLADPKTREAARVQLRAELAKLRAEGGES